MTVGWFRCARRMRLQAREVVRIEIEKKVKTFGSPLPTRERGPEAIINS